MPDTWDLLVGCSFTDPQWQDTIPWSVLHGQQQPSFICAKAGMGIKGICTEALYYLEDMPNQISRVIIMLPTIWRYDIEVSEQTYLCNSMVDLLQINHSGWHIHSVAKRKWITSGGLNYDRNTEMAVVFDFLYKHQDYLVIAKEHFRALKRLIDFCQYHKLKYYISAIQDPLDQLTGLDYIRDQIVRLLQTVEYQNWLTFDGKFVDGFLGHRKHPDTNEHQHLCNQIDLLISKDRE